MRYSLICLSSVCVLLLSACFQAVPAATPVPTTFYRQISTASAPTTIPTPTGETILTLDGLINASNSADNDVKRVEMDLALLQSLRQVEYRVLDEQGEGREALFRGVLMSDLLAYVQADASATALSIAALDGYSVTIPMSDIRAYEVLLALTVDGELMALDRRGPTRIVYPYGYRNLDASVYDARWIWNVDTITLIREAPTSD